MLLTRSQRAVSEPLEPRRPRAPLAGAWLTALLALVGSLAAAPSAAESAAAPVQAPHADAVLVGGSGLYVSSVLFDFRFPPRDEELRARLEAELDERGPGSLYARLRELDPATA